MATWLRKHEDWLAWESKLGVDGDGAPNCYGPPGTKPLDYLANAGGPGNWYGVVTDPFGNPVVQGPDDPFPGMYVSPTSLQDRTKVRTDPARYVNSVEIPYLAVPRNAVSDYGVKLGDVGFAYNRANGHMCAALVADIGPKNKWGEGSIALARELGVPSSPKNGGVSQGVVVVIFKGTSRGWPRTHAEVTQQVQDRLEELGGTEFYLDMIKPQS